MKPKTKIVVITGAESTGKSNLTQWLANHFSAPLIPEYARKYVENLDRKYNYRDVEIIAEKQVEQLQQLQNSNAPFIFADTWLIITKVWFEVVFQKIPDWLEKEIQNAPIDFFLICDTDIPWEADSVRENGGEKRVELQQIYINNIQKFNFPYAVVSGTNEVRYQNALQNLSLLKK